MTVCYFDVDDEITNVVSRVRAADSDQVTLVLPPGSRIATSRINFLILAREARSRSRTLAVVSGEPGVRALAVSAGLPAYPSVEESEQALAADRAVARDPAGDPPRDPTGDPPRSTGRAGSSDRGGGTGGRGTGRDRSAEPAVAATGEGDPAPDGLWAGVIAPPPQTHGPDAPPPAAPWTARSSGAPSTIVPPHLPAPAPASAATVPASIAPPAGAPTITAAAPVAATGAMARTDADATGRVKTGLRKVMARPIEQPPDAPATPQPTPAATGAPATLATRDPAWREEPWLDSRGRGHDAEAVTAPSPAPVRTVAPHSAAVDAASTAAGTETSLRAQAVEDHARARGRVQRRVSFAVRLMVVLIVLAIAAGASYLYLPTAEIALTPRTQVAGPVTVTIVADPSIRVVDPVGSRIPADVLSVPLTVSDSFPATGTAVSLTKASGSVRFTSENTLFDVTVPNGTRVSTTGGIAFATRREIVVPKASFATGPTTKDVDVQAVQAGPSGNVAAGAIRREPDTLTQSLVSVTNPEASSGGRRIETRQVQKRDYDAAVKTLTARLGAELGDALADPSVASKGLTIYPATATVEDARPNQASGDLVGTKATSFTLTVSATGHVLGVDRSLLEQLAVDRLTSGVPQGSRLLDGTTATTIDDPVIEDGTIRYAVEARALQWRPVEPSTIITAVRGRSVQEATTTLQQYGTASVRHWPEFLDSMPSQDFRITVSIHEPSAP